MSEEETKTKAAPKTMQVRVVHAVDKYHTRGANITVPNDTYHKGLVKSGYLALIGA